MANRYWVGGSGSWDTTTTTHWSATSGGAGGASVPGLSDSPWLDSKSGGGTVTLSENISTGIFRDIGFTGTFNTDGRTFSVIQFIVIASSDTTITLGSSTIICSAADDYGYAWYVADASHLTFNANASTIKLTASGTVRNSYFVGGGLTYNNVWVNTISTTGRTIILDSNTYNNLIIDPRRTITFIAGTTHTFNSFTTLSNASRLITINSGDPDFPSDLSTATHTLVKTGGGIVNCDYLNIQHSIATPSRTWYAGANSVNNQATADAGSGWIFEAPVKTIVGVASITNINSITI